MAGRVTRGLGPSAVPPPLPASAFLAGGAGPQSGHPRGNYPYLPLPPYCPAELSSRASHRQGSDHRLPPPSGRPARTRPPARRRVRALLRGGVGRCQAGSGGEPPGARAGRAISLADSAPRWRFRACTVGPARTRRPALGAPAHSAPTGRKVLDMPVFPHLCWVSCPPERRLSALLSLADPLRLVSVQSRLKNDIEAQRG